MPDELAQEFASQSRSVVLAAAGCGKTELIARAVATNNEGRQLILTHTHAGIRALRDRLHAKSVKSTLYKVDTIAGFSLLYATSFPSTSGCRVEEPCSDMDWMHIYESALKSLHNKHIQNVLENSYTGLYVDEYQDCTKKQHDLIMVLAKLLPTRIVGDPLQGIFGFSKDDPLVDWNQDVYPFFKRLPDLEIPYRWLGNNEALGKWLIDVRKLLLLGNPIQLQVDGPVKWVKLGNPMYHQAAQINTCLALLKNSSDSIVVLRMWLREAHSISKKLKGRFRSMEEVECKDLLDWCERLEKANGIKKAELLLEFALTCMTRKPEPLNDLYRFLQSGEFPGENKLKKLALLKDILRNVAESGDLSTISAAHQIIADNPEVTFHRKELYREMVKVTHNFDESSGLSLRRTAWKIRDGARRFGRFIDPRVVSRTTLVKGLEFDHVVIVNAADFNDAKNLYVALTRGARSLTIMSTDNIIQRASPELEQ